MFNNSLFVQRVCVRSIVLGVFSSTKQLIKVETEKEEKKWNGKECERLWIEQNRTEHKTDRMNWNKWKGNTTIETIALEPKVLLFRIEFFLHWTVHSDDGKSEWTSNEKGSENYRKTFDYSPIPKNSISFPFIHSFTSLRFNQRSSWKIKITDVELMELNYNNPIKCIEYCETQEEKEEEEELHALV